MRTLHFVSHTHWDREWYLTFQQFRLKLVHLIDKLLAILEADPDYEYFMLDGQTIVLDDYLEVRPEKAGLLGEYIQRGRILVGPWHILPDEFLVSPEATIRNLLQGDHTARRFGPKMRVGYIPDPFGHIGQMPQILRGFDIETVALRRGLSTEPCELWWQGPDGSRVFTAYLRDSYDNAAWVPTSEPEEFAAEIRQLRDSLAAYAATLHVLLMHGTDHMEPSADTPRAVSTAAGKLDGDVLVQSTLPGFISAVQSQLASADPESPDPAIPTVHGELRDPRRHHLLVGVLSTRTWIKQRNHASETLLEKWAEPFSTFASLVTPEIGPAEGSRRLDDPASILRRTWRLLMENHPHDSICGCSIDQVHDEMSVRFDQVDQVAKEITRQSLEALASAMDTSGGEGADLAGAIVVFNPTAGPRTDVVTAELTLPPEIEGFEIVDGDGAVLPHQLLDSSSMELLNVVLDRSGLDKIAANMKEGRVDEFAIQQVAMERQGATLSIEAIMARDTDPDLDVFERGLEEAQRYLDDPEVTTFQIRAYSLGSNRIAFVAPEVPGHGWRTFGIRSTPRAPSTPRRIGTLMSAVLPYALRFAQTSWGQRLLARFSRPASRPPYRIENECLAVQVLKDGTLRVTDRRDGTVYRGLNRLVDGGDAGDEYNYSPPAADVRAVARLRKVRVQRGAIGQSLEIELVLPVPAELAPGRKSRSQKTVPLSIVSRVSLFPGVPRVDIQTVFENRARDHRLRVHFPLPFETTHAEYDGHFEVVRRPLGIPAHDATWVEEPRPEVPQRAFVDVSTGKMGLMVANRGLPEVAVLPPGRDDPQGGCEIALTLLRCVGWLSRSDLSTRDGHAGPMMATPGAQVPGRHTFEYALIPHAGDWRGAFSQAYAYNAPLRAVGAELHAGGLPKQGSFLEVEPDGFVLSAIKEAEDGHGWVVRGYNVGDETLAVRLAPWRRFASAARINMAERDVNDLPLAADGSIRLQAGPHQVVGVRFRGPARSRRG
jgi:mannosylglycerate hydrolase